MPNKINWGILGTGRIANAYAEGLKLVDDASLLAVGSRATKSASAFGTTHNVSRCYGSYAELAADPDLDVIYVATPHSLHKDSALLCLENGKAVLCEKPFTINGPEANAVIEVARAKNLFLMEAMWTRYFPAVVRLRELLADQVIGDLQLMLAGGGFIPESDPDYYMFNRDLGGGALLDAGVYLVSAASMIFGPPESVSGMATLGPTGVDEQIGFQLKAHKGAIASFYISLRTKASPPITLLGSHGRIEVHPPLFCPDKLTVEVDGRAPKTIELPYRGNGFQFEAAEVGRCLVAGKTESDIMPLDETLQIMHTMDEIRRQIGLRYPQD